ncbi:hypothetical protein F2Q68_00032042 [Brassica cretica]|uniref:Uncharacterized protein n=1 Tax=Brassica cretica TaxID=69181 RepID=A0A8S9GHG6_BRACR|nr:hypothetical protein F2Q68_00032042 [Brassica cretica]
MSLENLMVSIKKSKKPFKNIKIRLRINLDSGTDDRIQPASLSPCRTVATPADHASGYSIPRRRPRVIHGRFLFDNAGKGTRVAPPRVAVSSRFSNFVRAGTASRVAQAASELSVASCQRGLRVRLFLCVRCFHKCTIPWRHGVFLKLSGILLKLSLRAATPLESSRIVTSASYGGGFAFSDQHDADS